MTRSPRRRLAGLIVALAAAAPLSSCRTPQSEALIFQQLNEAADQFVAIRQEMAMVTDQLDSLRGVIAKQDSTIRKLANIAGLPIGGH